MLPLPSVLLREQLGLRAVPHPLIALSFSTDRNANVMKLSPSEKTGMLQSAALRASP